jgi:prevent-host-death family protein
MSCLTILALFAILTLIAGYTPMNSTQTGVNEQTIAAFDARRNFGKLLNGIKAGMKFVVKEHGEPVAAVVPLEEYEKWKQEREDAFRELSTIMDEAADNAHLSEKQALQLATDAVTAVRATGKAAVATS